MNKEHITKKILKFGDGLKHQRPELQREVIQLHTLLVAAGYPVEEVGFFGKKTERAVKAFQKDRGLTMDGIVGPKTWDALICGKGGNLIDLKVSCLLPGFRGDLSWVHAREGYAGGAYWPGGESGVTLDPGIDLGYASPMLVEQLYKGLISPEQYDAVKRVFGVKGGKAKEALSVCDELKSIRIKKSQSDDLFPHAAAPYWRAIVKRFATLSNSDTPSSVHTVLLSLSYNRGAGNRALDILRKPLEEKKWLGLAKLIGAMQQDHKISGIRKRRRMESELILSKVGV